MRQLRKNKQDMYYSNYIGQMPVYERDEFGNILYYEDEEGERYPLESSSGSVAQYTNPIPFRANISTNLSESQLEAYGVNEKAIYSQIICAKEFLPIEIGSLIWKRNEIKYLDEEAGIPDPSTADFTVKGILVDNLYSDKFLLQRNSSEVE